MIEEFAASSVPCPSGGDGAVGGIVPHAGWIFSGRIACSVIQCLRGEEDPETVLIFGRHLHPGSANFIMSEGQWATPLGDLEIDGTIAKRLLREFDFTIETARSCEPDNTIELQLPFIKYFFPNSTIVPMGLPPRASSLEIAKRSADVVKEMGRKALIVGSTDLTHYGYNYGYTPKGVGEEAVTWVKNVNDKEIVDLMVDMDEREVIRKSLQNHNACCGGAAASAIAAARVLGARKGKKLIYGTSYDVRPDSSFVGYVGIVFQR
jgi:AmmeMemoRadiSam system protein B